MADAQKIEDYIEATYDCADDGCFGQSSNSWESHDCADELRVHLAKRDLEEKDISGVAITTDWRHGIKAEYQAKVGLKRCEGSLYVDLTGRCRIKKDYTRGDCELAGVDAY